jgi:hypothetical protein
VVGGIRARKHHGDSLLMRNKRNYNGKNERGILVSRCHFYRKGQNIIDILKFWISFREDK